MSTDYFQSHTVSLVLSWIFFFPIVFGAIGGIVYLLFGKIEEGIPRAFLIWMLICVFVFSPFRYIILQLILYEAYSIQSISAFISGLVLTTYIYFIFLPLWAVGMALPGVGIIAITGFKDTTSKTRLILASVAAPFLFSIGSFLFFNILPYAAYTTHWLKAENVIRATNGPAEYYNKYLTRWEIELNRKQYGMELGLNLTSKDMLRAHVAANYLSKEQLAYYISKAYPELAKHLKGGSLSANDRTDFNKEDTTFTEYIDDEYGYAFHYPSDLVIQKTPEGNEMGEVRVLLLGARGTISVTVGHLGSNVTREQFNNSSYSDVLVEEMIDFTIEQVYRKSSRKLRASNMVIVEKKTLPSDTGILFYIKTTYSTNEGIPMSVSGIHAMPFGKDYIIGFLMITGLKKENETLRSAFNSFHLIGEQPIVVWEADTQNKKSKVSELPKDYRGELYPHFSYEGLEYVGEFYQNYAYANIDDAGGLADNHYVASVFVAREDFGVLVYNHNSHKFAVMDAYELKNKTEPEFHNLAEDNFFVKMWNKAKSSEWEDKDIKIGTEDKKWVYFDAIAQKEEINGYYFDSKILYDSEIGFSSVVFLIMNEKRYTFYFDPDNNTFAPVASDFFWVPLEEMKYREMKEGGIGSGVWNFIKDRISAENSIGN